ncbi:hypothetical protein RJT34_20275 [Clitoria ternatea]|uniref:Uncharacterized protein n=1 Tax=Clitoria ternatea TaxID=43366 RepID=A0AAN9ISM3_CLITE
MYQDGSHMYGTRCESYMGISILAKVVESEQLSFEPTESQPCNIITTPLHQTSQGFCGSHVGYQAQEHEQHHVEVPTWCFEFPNTTTTTIHSSTQICRASGDNFTRIGTKQDLPSSQFTSSLYPVAESFLSSSAESQSSSEKYSNFPSYSEKYSNFQPDSYDHFSQEDDRLLRDDAATNERPLEISFQTNQLASCIKPEKQAPQRLCGGACVNSSNFAFRSSKRRIRWTKDLHEPFMTIVNTLGGPEKAKPKAILEMMKSDLLSISHIKSHLQKCRTTIHMHKALQERTERGNKTDGDVTDLQVKIISPIATRGPEEYLPTARAEQAAESNVRLLEGKKQITRDRRKPFKENLK